MAKYSKQIVKEICGYLEDGLAQKDAARLAGISESTFYEWLSTKSEFSESLMRAMAKYKYKLVTMVNTQAVNDGKLALEVLARRFPQEYGEKAIPHVEVDARSLHINSDVKRSGESIKELAERIKRLSEAGSAQQAKDEKPEKPA